MTALSNLTAPRAHGTQCSCQLLALAVGINPRALSFGYCYRVLQKRWRMTCTHGEINSALPTPGIGERWRDVGSIDPVRAILMSNDPQER